MSNFTKNEIEEKLYWYKAKIKFIYDADTFTAHEIDFGFGLSHKVARGDRGASIRFGSGVDAYELSSEKGIEARDYIKPLENTECYLRSEKDKKDKYGRYIFNIYVDGSTFGEEGYIDLGAHLINKGYAIKNK